MSSEFSNRKNVFTDDDKFKTGNEKLQKLNDKVDSSSKLNRKFICICFFVFKFILL